MSNEAAPASSLTDKEREAIAQMPYEEAVSYTHLTLPTKRIV